MTNKIEELNLYVDSNSTIHEGKLFETFILVKPLRAKGSVRKVDLVDFGKEFQDFEGNREEVRDFLRGMAAPMTIN
jgi:hypothetical protein